MKNSILIVITLNLSFIFSQNQSNMYVRGEINGWGSNSMTRNDLGTDTWVVTISEAETDGTSEFKFANTSDWSGTDWSRGDVVTIGSKTTWYDPNGANGSFSQISGKYYTFTIKDVADDNNSEGYIFEFSQAPISISSVSNVGNGLASNAYTVTVTLSGTPDANEMVYVRYSSDSWLSSSVVEGDPSSTSIDIDIPGQSAGATVSYYVFTSITGISDYDADLATIDFDNNSGSNYSYYVENGTVGILGDESMPTEFHTYSAFPNPFNNVVVLKWDIPSETNFSISIFDIMGRQVWFKNCGKVMPGQYSIRWNGKDIYYQTVSGGIYFVRTRTGENVTQQKILFLK